MNGHKGRCAIFPVSEDDDDKKRYHRSEYLLLYPYIKRAAVVDFQRKTYVTESANRYVEFGRWVKGHASPEYNYKNIDVL